MTPDFAHVGDFCPNPACPDYGQLKDNQQNIKKAGKTGKGVQRYRCKTCGQTFTQTKGTIFYRRRTDAREIIETLALIAEGVRISSLSRVKGHFAVNSDLKFPASFYLPPRHEGTKIIELLYFLP